MGVQINGDTGNVIATKGTYSGNVTIGGTLTYEDVTNIDSVGLVTAREGIEVGARPGVGASISVDGNAIFSGITTATTLRAPTGIVTTFVTNTAKVGAAVTISESGIEASGIGITCANINGTQIGGRKNIIINGAMMVAQRGTSSTTSGYGSVDRFQHTHNGTDEAPTFEQADVASGTTPYTLGFRKSLKVTNGNQTSGAGASDYIYISQRIESQNTANSGWNYTSASSFITLSFWVKSSVAQEFHGFLLSADGTRKLYSFSLGSLSANTWTKVIKTIPGTSDLQFDNDTAQGILFRVAMFRGTDGTGTITQNQWGTFDTNVRYPNYTSTWYTTNDATFELTGVQLEVGSQATPFEHRSYGEELSLCQRYYETHNHLTTAKTTDGSVTSQWSTITSNDSNTLVVSTGIIYKVPKRASPTVTLYNSSDTTTASRVNAQGTERTVSATYGGPSALTRIYVTGASSGNYVTFNWEAESEL